MPTVSAYAGSCATDGSGQEWTSPSLAQGAPDETGDGSAVANVNCFGGDSSRLVATGFGLAVPAGSTINSVTVVVWKRTPGGKSATNVFDKAVQLVVAGSPAGANKADAAAWSNSTVTPDSYSFTSSLPTVAQINASNFGAAISTLQSNNNHAWVDAIQVTVDYTPPVYGSVVARAARAFRRPNRRLR